MPNLAGAVSAIVSLNQFIHGIAGDDQETNAVPATVEKLNSIRQTKSVGAND